MSNLDALYKLGELPLVIYPKGVFLGRVLSDEILPRLRGVTSFSPKAETALTLAALQLALIGVAVAWVPETLAREYSSLDTSWTCDRPWEASIST